MLLLSSIVAGYCVYFIVYLIPRIQNVTMFLKIVTIVVLYVSISAIIKHLTSLNSVLIKDDSMELGFLLRTTIHIEWQKLIRMDIYKVITHYWKISYLDEINQNRIFKTSLAFPGIIQILLLIQDHKPEVEMNDLLRNVLIYKRNLS